MLTIFADGSFRFQNPLGLLLLIPVFILAVILYTSGKKGAILFSSLTVFHCVPKTPAAYLLPIVRGFLPAGLALSVIAFARPQMGEENFRIRSEGIAMAICLDRSGSMRTPDFILNGKQVDRFTAVKQIFNDFVLGNTAFTGRPDDRIALIVFGGFVDSLCPLTLDHHALASALKMVAPPEPPTNRYGQPVIDELFQEESATAIGDALVAGIDRLKEEDAKSKVIVLLSDGAQNVGAVTADEAAETANNFGIRVYTIGIGTTGNTFDPLEFDEETLKRIAEKTGGEYFSAANTETLARVCEKIDSLEKTVHEEKIFTRCREYYRVFLITGLALILTGTFLTHTRFRSLPE